VEGLHSHSRGLVAVRTVFHVDIDAFYPSVEIARDPSLKGKPVIVGADPKGGEGRGVVMSCSYEAREMGVRSGQPISRAFRRCPEAVYLRPNFELYDEVSERIMEILRGFADRFEQVSIDEAFMDVSDKVPEHGSPEELAKRIKEAVRRTEGMTCSIGVAPNKSAAKIASALKKPDGLVIVPQDRVKEFLAPLPVTRISGVGKKTRQELNSLRISNIGDLAEYPSDELLRRFGKVGVWLWSVANGLEQMEVSEVEEMKSLSAERTFEEDVEDRGIVLEAIEHLSEDVHRRLASEDLVYRTVGIKVRFEDFQTFTRERSLPNYTDEKGLIARNARRLFKEFEGDERRIRLIGVRISSLREEAEEQRTLLEWAE